MQTAVPSVPRERNPCHNASPEAPPQQLIAAAFCSDSRRAPSPRSESGDAGDLPATAQDLGSGAVTQILGSFANGGDADVYRVCLSDGTSFSASTVGATTRDTQLFLFNADGLGIYANDDAGSGCTARGCPPATASRPPVGRRVLPRDQLVQQRPAERRRRDLPGHLLRPACTPTASSTPSGSGAHEPVTAGPGSTRGSAGSYRINLTGTTGCDTTPPTVRLRQPRERRAREAGGRAASWTSAAATRGGSGLASCVGSVARRRAARHEPARPGLGDRDRARQRRQRDRGHEHGHGRGPDQADDHPDHARGRARSTSWASRWSPITPARTSRTAPGSTRAWAPWRTARRWTPPRSARRPSP